MFGIVICVLIFLLGIAQISQRCQIVSTPEWVCRQVVQMLLDHGALVDSENQDGWTPLLYAARYGHAKVVKPLVSNSDFLTYNFS